MFKFLRTPEKEAAPTGPVLDLSGPRLRRAFENLVEAAEATGGVERYVTALSLKASLFEEVLGRGHVREMTKTEFLDLAAFITPVRRRVGGWLGQYGFDLLRDRLARLMDGWSDPATGAARIQAFCDSFPKDKEHRWVRDLAAEALHFTAPDRYPLMTRWVWDQKVGTGVIREIWFAEDVDSAKIDVGDGIDTFRALAAELEGFLKEQGVFRDLPLYTDLLMAHVYAAYINDRGGQYLRQDFSAEGDNMAHTRRMLGLDAVDTESGRTRLKLIDGTAHVLGGAQAITHQEAS